MARWSERGPELLGFVALDDVADLIVVPVIELYAAFQAGAHLVGVVLEALERRDLALVHDLLAAAQARGGVAAGLPLGDEAARHETLGQRKSGADLGSAELDL